LYDAIMTTRLHRGFLLIALAVLAFAPAPALADTTEKLDPLLKARAAQLSGRSRVIVQFRTQPDARVISRRGGIVGRQLRGLAAQVAELNNSSLAALAGDPQVARVVLDRPVFPTLERTGGAVGATLAREELGLTGRGVGVAVIDSGVTSAHDDLYLTRGHSPRRSSRVAHFKDFTTTASSGLWLSELATDEFGHGTHVAGIIAGNGFDSDGARTGVAPGVNLVALKVLDGEGHGFISDVIDALDYAVAIKDTYNIRVINLSVASGVFESYRTDPLAQAARRAVQAGIVVVASAGNLGADENGEPQFGGITSPGNAPWVLTVGASSHGGTIRRGDDTIPTFSSRGPTWIDFSTKPDLVAPGVGIESLAAPNSTLYGTHPEYLLDGTAQTAFKPYLSLSGTSMAAPVVAGTAALMLEANPSLTPNAVKALLQYTAEIRHGEHYLAQGAGLLNARGAVRMAQFFETPQKGLPVPVDAIDGEVVEWGRHLIWGNVRVDGGLPLPDGNAWALDVTWGDDVAAGEPVVWGVSYDDNIVWSTYNDDNIVWSTARGDNIVWSTAKDENIVWSTARGDNIVWSTAGDENIVWSTYDDDNIVWSTALQDNIVWSTTHLQNVVWGQDCGGANCPGVLWGAHRSDGTLWGTYDDDNIVWSTYGDDNIVWSTALDDNIVWSTSSDDNIVWSTYDDNIVWSTYGDDNIVWSTYDDNIVWSTNTVEPVRWPAAR
jgi:serine protease AprX